MPENRTPLALKAMAQEDPELAARLVLQTLPGAAAQIPGKLVYDMDVEGLGNWRVAVADGSAKVTPVADGDSNGKVDFRLKMDPRTLADLATGAGPLGLMLSGRLRVQGKRRRALRLRALAGAQPTMADVVAQGGKIDAGLLYRSLTYLIDPEWTRGHRFVVCYVLEGDEGGRWYVHVSDGERVVVTTEPPEGGADCTFSFSPETYNGLVTGTLTPTDAARFQLTKMEGKTYYGTLLGRWIDRSQGNDDAELEREAQQRELQQRRLGSWGGTTTNGAVPLAASVAGQGDPAHDSEGARRSGGSLLSYEQLYALWERQNWKAHEIDFSVDREHWLVTPRASQVDTAWSLASFYIGEERVTADLAPFLLAAPSGEIELFLATQLVDEARHTAMFDRFGSEVMALTGDDLRSRLRELEQSMLSPWHEVFDGTLREIAERIKAQARRPRPVRGRHRDLPHGHRGGPGDDRAAPDRQVLRGARPVPGLPPGLLPGGARRAPPHRLRRALPEGRRGTGAALQGADRGADRGPRAARRACVRAAVCRQRQGVHLLRLQLPRDLRLRVPQPEAPHGRDRPGVPAGRGDHAGPHRGARRAARRSSLRARRSTGSPR